MLCTMEISAACISQFADASQTMYIERLSLFCDFSLALTNLVTFFAVYCHVLAVMAVSKLSVIAVFSKDSWTAPGDDVLKILFQNRGSRMVSYYCPRSKRLADLGKES